MFSIDPEVRRTQRAVLLMVSATAFANALMLSSANVALPDIAGDLAIDAVLLNWIPLAFLTAAAKTSLALKASDSFPLNPSNALTSRGNGTRGSV